MKKILAAAGITAMALSVSVVSAATVKNVSDDSTATSAANYLIKVLMKNNNSATINNNVSATGNSGGNTFASADDQSGTEIHTGNSTSGVLVENSANNNMIEAEYTSYDGTTDLIDGVNDSSTASTTLTDTLDNDMENSNNVTVDNVVFSNADTGNNTVTSGDSLEDTKGFTGIAQALTGVASDFNFNFKKIKRTKN